MPIRWQDGAAVTGIHFENGPAVHAAYFEDQHAPVFTRADPPVISNWGASSGSGNHSILTCLLYTSPSPRD